MLDLLDDALSWNKPALRFNNKPYGKWILQNMFKSPPCSRVPVLLQDSNTSEDIKQFVGNRLKTDRAFRRLAQDVKETIEVRKL
jgi:hypothetical protein